jgi:hypothetical protein
MISEAILWRGNRGHWDLEISSSSGERFSEAQSRKNKRNGEHPKAAVSFT